MQPHPLPSLTDSSIANRMAEDYHCVHTVAMTLTYAASLHKLHTRVFSRLWGKELEGGWTPNPFVAAFKVKKGLVS